MTFAEFFATGRHVAAYPDGPGVPDGYEGTEDSASGWVFGPGVYLYDYVGDEQPAPYRYHTVINRSEITSDDLQYVAYCLYLFLVSEEQWAGVTPETALAEAAAYGPECVRIAQWVADGNCWF